MYPSNYSQKLAMSDLRVVIKMVVNVGDQKLAADDADKLKSAELRLGVLTSTELLDVVVAHLRSGVGVGRYIPSA